jgi:phospholipid-translocating ATPase
MTACVITINIKLLLETHYFNVLMVASFVLTIAMYFVLSMFYNAILWRIVPTNLYGSLTTVLSSPAVWLLILLLVCTALLPDFIIRVLTDMTSSVYKRPLTRKTKSLPYAKDYITAVAFSRLNGLVTISQTNLIEESQSHTSSSY